MWHEYINASTLEEVLEILASRGNRARIIAGGTDLILEIENGVRKGIDTLVDVTRIPGLDQISMDSAGMVHLGPLVTHNDCAASPLLRKYGLPLALASWEVGAPQIRNRSTVAGNIITASPANDTITPLMALDAKITLRSLRGERVVPFSAFYEGFRQTVIKPDEMLVDISFPAMEMNQRGMFVKLGLRRAQAISVVHVAMLVTFEQDDKTVQQAAITLGAVTPVIVHAAAAEQSLAGKPFTVENIARAAQLAQQAAKPIDDLRGSAAYRMEMVRVCTLRGLRAIMNHEENLRIPEAPILLSGPSDGGALPNPAGALTDSSGISARVNGLVVNSPAGHDKTLLRWLREDLGLIGTKEGCAEGECGACTVFLDGKAVMSCLVPAARAQGADIITIEGLAQNGELHPVQQTFVEEGAVQCGYCTPGFVMAAAKLLEERPRPSLDDLQQSITGNLCRCTGYYKILKAMENAARLKAGMPTPN